MVYTFLLCIKFLNFNQDPYFEDTKLTKTLHSLMREQLR